MSIPFLVIKLVVSRTEDGHKREPDFPGPIFRHTIRTDKNTWNCELSDDERYVFITADDYLLRVNLNSYSN
ncbi:hypothetical protein SAMN05421636_10715 [Pricia antarctica]|uniref:Uncharacterized protein n=1 Tax=Pricia antarctica TaxID=641691 RepID=A0A1G7F970_9FLAO|nr:hypothetical protein SAMN05421636_10715 [Pricia antarctica]